MSYFNKPVYTWYQGTAAFTTAWTVVPMSSTTVAGTEIRQIEAFTGCGELLELGYGSSTAAAVTLNYTIIPGGNPIPKDIFLSSGMRLFIRAPITNASANNVCFNFFG